MSDVGRRASGVFRCPFRFSGLAHAANLRQIRLYVQVNRSHLLILENFISKCRPIAEGLRIVATDTTRPSPEDPESNTASTTNTRTRILRRYVIDSKKSQRKN